MYWSWKSPHRSAVQVNFVSEDDERKVVWIAGGGLDEELVAPAIQRLEGGGRGHVVDLQERRHRDENQATLCHITTY